MTRFKGIIAYDGTDFFGWQIQPDKKTVASVLQTIFATVFKEKIKILGASRTDAGVHALGQVISFSTKLEISAEHLRWAWQRSLPESISIISLQKVADDFRPRRNVVQKTYWYDVFINRPLPFVARYGYFYPYDFDAKKLQQALEIFVGTHDFSAFTSDERANKVRTIDSISLNYLPEENKYRIEIKGRGFLHFMLRRIVGACLKVAGDQKIPLEKIEHILKAKNPEHNLPTAPAKGLILAGIEYKV